MGDLSRDLNYKKSEKQELNPDFRNSKRELELNVFLKKSPRTNGKRQRRITKSPTVVLRENQRRRKAARAKLA